MNTDLISKLQDEIDELKIKKVNMTAWVMEHPQSHPDEYMKMMFAQGYAMDAYKMILEFRVDYLKRQQESDGVDK